MKKSIKRILRTLGSAAIILSILLSCACSTKETTKKKKKTSKKTTTEETEETDEPTDAPTDSTDPTDPTDTTDPTTPVAKKYTGAEASKRLHELDEEIFTRRCSGDILSMIFSLENPESVGMSWPETGIECWSEEDIQESEEFCEYILTSLDEIDETALELEDEILWKSLKRDYQLSVDMEGMDYYTSSINDLTGENVNIPILFATMVFDSKEDVERYLICLNDVKPYFESLFEYEKKRAELGFSLPDDILQKIVESLEAVYKDHDGNYMYTTFEERIAELNLDDATAQDFIKRNKEILDTSFFPAYEELAANMKTLFGTAKTSGKLCEMEGGKEFYEKYLQSRSGTNLSVEECMELLETMIYEYYMEAEAIMNKMTPEQQKQVGIPQEYTTGSFESDLEYCKEVFQADFPDLGEIPCRVYHIPESLKDNFSPAAYMSCPKDDPSNNLLMVNDLGGGNEDMLSTVAHEALPGHMYETVYHAKKMHSYYAMGGSTAYKEGWSTYSEDYIMRFTNYDLDVYRVNYLFLTRILNYAMQAYMDIGIHYYGWDKQQAKDELTALYNASFASSIVDFAYDRVLEIPCYVTPYCFGNYYCPKIINDAVAQYGDEYSMSEIHAAYLDMGPSNFQILQEYMPKFVEKQH